VRLLIVFVGIVMLLIAAGCAVLAHEFNTMYEPKPEFATIAWVGAAFCGLAGAFLILGSKPLSGSDRRADRETPHE
jgi:hypothetical protein